MLTMQPQHYMNETNDKNSLPTPNFPLPLPPYSRSTNQPKRRQQQRRRRHKEQQYPSSNEMSPLISPPTPVKPPAFVYSPSAASMNHKHSRIPSPLPQLQHSTSISQHCNSHLKKKKTVSFAPTATVQPINIPKASDMTLEEKQIVWYLANDYSQFKNDAASDGGVKVVPRVTATTTATAIEEQAAKSCQFVCIGNFDGDCDDPNSSANNDTNHSSDAATTSSNRSSPSGKYYNEHEYNDYTTNTGQEVCKRGLGYHFSRIRKHNRLLTRNTVIAWQTCLMKESNVNRMAKAIMKKMQTPHSSTNHNSDLLRQMQNTHANVLASVSSKNSRVSREEARWRGTMDFRVAYPERCHSDDIYGIQRKRSSESSKSEDGLMYHVAKRRRSNVGVYSGEAVMKTAEV